jgi:hypothetical protein
MTMHKHVDPDAADDDTANEVSLRREAHVWPFHADV